MTRRGPARRCKRRRVYYGDEEDCKTKRLRNVNIDDISYFDLLPYDCLDAIMKHVSEKPLSKQWEDYMSISDVEMFIDPKHPLSECAQNRFGTLMACDTYPHERRGLLVHGKGSKAIQGFRNTAFALSEILTDIFIYQTSFPPLWRRTLISCCPNLKTLSLNSAQMGNIFPFESIIQAHSNQLESLEITWSIASSSQIDSMSNNLKGLKRLSIMFDNIEKSFENVWKCVGSSLQELAILEMSRVNGVRVLNYEFLKLSKLHDYCKHIEKLDFELPPPEIRNTLIDLFVSYGNQLKTLTLIRCGFESNHLREICKHCSNIRLDIAEFRGLNISSLIEIGKNASLVNFGCNTFKIFNEWNLRELGNIIENLSGFCVSAYSVNVVKGIELIFKNIKYQLTFIRIENNPIQFNSSIFKIIGNRFPNLLQIEITEVLPHLHDLIKLGPLCPNVKELIFLSIIPNSFKICACKFDAFRNLRPNNGSAVGKGKKLNDFILAVQAFPALLDVDYSCVAFDGTKSPIVPSMKKALRVRPARKLCITMCGNNYA